MSVPLTITIKGRLAEATKIKESWREEAVRQGKSISELVCEAMKEFLEEDR